MKSQLFLPFYAGLLVLILIIVIFVVDKETPNTVFVLLLAMYIGLMLYYWRQFQSKPKTRRIPSINDYKTSSRRPAVLSNFQSEAESIMREINMQNTQRNSQFQYYSPYSRSSGNPLTLAQIQVPANDYPQQSNIFGTYSIQIWREQFRLAQEQFKLNLRSEIKNRDTYVSVLTKLNLNTANLAQAQQIAQSFLKDRSSQYCIHTLKVVNQMNKILSRNFGLSLTIVQSTNPKQIQMSELDKMLVYFQNNRSLPSPYRNLAVSPPNQTISNPNVSLGRFSNMRLENDLMQLMKLLSIIKPMGSFPSQMFNAQLLIYILNIEFPSEKLLQAGPANSKIYSQMKGNSTSAMFLRNNEKQTQYLLIQVDYWMSLDSVPQFRTKNCKKLCLIYLLLLIKRDNCTGHPMLRSLRRLLR